MLFAAGFGTRMGALTQTTPKPLIPVAGKALIDHTLDLVQAIQPQTIVANLHYLPDQLEAHLADTPVKTLTETPEILETGGGLRNALPLLGKGPVFTSNTDAIWKGPNPFALLQSAWDPEKMDALLLCVPTENTIGHKGAGDFTIAADGQITRGPGTIYGGIQILKTDGLTHIKERAFSLNLLWDDMRKRETLYGLPYPGTWCDVGNADSIALAEQHLKDANV